MSDSNHYDLAEIETKLTAARTKLILDKPFLGALILRLPLQNADPEWCMTSGTDAKKFYYNPAYIDALSNAETQFVLAHEALHCALSHFARRQHRVKHRWDIACDYAINSILVDEGLTAPPNALLLYAYKNMTAEEIYPLIADNDMSDTLDQHLYDKEDEFSEGGQDSSDNPLDESQGNSASQNSSGDNSSDNTSDQGLSSSHTKQEFDDHAGGAPPPPPLQQQEAEELSLQWQQRLAGAAQQAEQAGKLSAIMKRFIEGTLHTHLPWRMLLARYMSAMAKDDYSYTRPSSRRGDPAIYPRLKSNQISAVIAVDVSGSVSDKELKEFLSEINAIKSQVRAKITLLPCDSELIEGSPFVFEPWDEVAMPKQLKGGGTTSFIPVFNWINRQDQAPDIVIYFTDGCGIFPPQEPHYPTIWLIKGKQKVPWGERMQLN